MEQMVKQLWSQDNAFLRKRYLCQTLKGEWELSRGKGTWGSGNSTREYLQEARAWRSAACRRGKEHRAVGRGSGACGLGMQAGLTLAGPWRPWEKSGASSRAMQNHQCFMQGRNMITLIILRDHFSCKMEKGSEEKRALLGECINSQERMLGQIHWEKWQWKKERDLRGMEEENRTW